MITFTSVSPRAATVVAVPKGLARYATDVTTTSATSEAQVTADAIALTFATLADSLAEQKIGALIAESLAPKGWESVNA
jgi:hypothetical protein